jgi:hypothetical protein
MLGVIAVSKLTMVGRNSCFSLRHRVQTDFGAKWDSYVVGTAVRGWHFAGNKEN